MMKCRCRLNHLTPGFSLPVVLAVLSAVMLLVISGLSLMKSSRLSTRSYQEHYSMELAMESAQEDAFAKLAHSTNRDSFMTHLHQDESGDPSYFLNSWYDPATGTWKHQPLYSGASIESVSPPPNQLVMTGQASDRYAAYSAEVDRSRGSLLLKNLRLRDSDPETRIEFHAPRVSLNEKLSYAYWIEDLNGLLDYEAMTYFNSEAPHAPYESSVNLPHTDTPLLNSDEIAGRSRLKIRDQRHLGLNIFSSMEEAQYEYPISYGTPFTPRENNPHGDPEAPRPPAHPFQQLLTSAASPSSYCFNTYSLPTVLLETENSRAYESLKDYLTMGLPETFELDVIPYGHNYKSAGSTLKPNLNHYLQRVLMIEGNRAEEPLNNEIDFAQTIDDVVTLLSDRIKEVPGFKDSPEEYQSLGLSVSEQDVRATRYGGFPVHQESYIKTLAASILDYADTDSTSTCSDYPINEFPNSPDLREPTLQRPESGKRYRGIDAMPLLSEASRKYRIVANYERAGQFYAVIEVRTFLEIWNPTDKPIHGYVKFSFYPHHSHELTTPSGRFSLPSEELYYWGGSVNLRANEYKVIEVTNVGESPFQGAIGDAGYSHYEVPVSEAAGALQIALEQASTHNLCKLSWFSIDSSSHPVPREDGVFRSVCGFFTPFNIENTTISASENRYTSVGVHLGHESLVGDLRNNIYKRDALSSVNGHRSLSFGTNATYGGPNYHRSFSIGGRVNPQAKFPDGAYNNAFHGDDPPSDGRNYLPGEYGYIRSDDPAGVSNEQPYRPYSPYTQEEALRYIQPISNEGRYSSLGELGNIYDPAQWKEVKRQTTHNNDHTPNDPVDSTDYTTQFPSAAAYAYYGQDLRASERSGNSADALNDFGGGMTLAIGSPEMNAFDPFADPTYDRHVGGKREGYEAARLLDVFRVTDSPLRSLKARVNLNTAPKKVLTALFSSFTHEKDEIMRAFTRQPEAEAGSPASALVNGVIEHRGKTPYRSLSDIALARGSVQGKELYLFGEKAFYERNRGTENGFGIEQDVWKDEGREELFCRLHDLFTTQSRAYRVHLKVEYKEGGRVHTATKVIDLTLHPKYILGNDPERRYTIDPHTTPEIRVHRTLK